MFSTNPENLDYFSVSTLTNQPVETTNEQIDNEIHNEDWFYGKIKKFIKALIKYGAKDYNDLIDNDFLFDNSKQPAQKSTNKEYTENPPTNKEKYEESNINLETIIENISYFLFLLKTNPNQPRLIKGVIELIEILFKKKFKNHQKLEKIILDCLKNNI